MKFPIARFRAARDSRGVALLTTLIILSAIALIVISFLALARHESTVSGFQVDDLRAEYAVEAAFQDARALLTEHTATDDYLVSVVTKSDPATGRPTRYTFLSQPGEETVRHVPLFAGGREQELGMPLLDQAGTASLAKASPNAPAVSLFPDLPQARVLRTFSITHLIDGNPVPEATRPTTGLVSPEPSPNGEKRIRYTYWIEDLQGFPNLDAVGSWTDDFDAGDTPFLAANHIRYGYGPDDLRTTGGPTPDSGRRYTLPDSPSRFGFQFPRQFRGHDSVGQIAPGLDPREIFLQAWSTGTLKAEEHPFAHAAELAARRHWLPASGGMPHADTTIENRFATGLHAYRDRPLIPWGHGYADAGQARYALNHLVRQADVDEIAHIIDTNLPKFVDRQGGFPDDYVKTLAANLVDYADDDALPTLGAGYRGIDSYPVVNELYLRFEYQLEKRGSTFLYRFLATPYLEFWNPGNREAILENFRFRFEFTNSLGFSSPTGEFLDFRDTDPVRNEAFDQPKTIEVMANQFEVIRLGEIEWEFSVEAPGLVDAPLIAVYDFLEGGYSNDSEAHFEILIDGAAGPTVIQQESRQSFRFRAFYGSNVKDQSGRSPFRSGTYFWRGVPIGMSTTGVKVGTNYGDPWMGFYTTGQQLELYYANDASVRGRNFRYSKADNEPRFKDRQRVHGWPDRGYSSPVPPGPPGSYRVTPEEAAAAAAAPDVTLAPFRINNTNRYWSVTELGHLHDHHMWHPQPGGGYDYIGELTFENDPENLLWDLKDQALPDSRWGGGSTLRIGRKEFTKFDKPGMRASQLLDLFHTGINGTNLPILSWSPDAYRHYDPRDHQAPPTARTEAEATQPPYRELYSLDEHAESPFRKVHGQLNLNSVPTVFEVETLLRGMFASSSVMADPGSTGTLDGLAFRQEVEPDRAVHHGLDPEACSRIAERLIAARPFYSPSHLARVLGQLIHEEGAMPVTVIDGEAHTFFNDAEAEETFARLFNLTTLSSRHFRIFAYGEVLSPQTDDPIVLARASKVYEVFLEPVRDPVNGEIERVECRVLSAIEH